MLSVSAAYKTAINSSYRNMKAILEVVFNNGIVSSAVASAGTGASSACDGFFRPTDFSAVGSISNAISNGWRGVAVSNSSGVITSENITISYTPAVVSKHLWVVGRLGNYPVDFTVQVQEAGVWSTVATVVGNTNWAWFMQLASAKTIQAVKVTVTKISTASDTVWIVECGVVNKVLFTGDDVTYATLLAETSSESRNPVGSITSNELTVDLNNENGWFTLTNSGPIAGLVFPGIKVKMHTGVQLADTNFEFVPWGTFYVTDWNAPTGSVVATITANDRLHKLLEKNTPNLLPLRSTTIKDLFQRLFTAIGLTSSEYSIDSTLTRVVSVGWIPKGKVGAALQEYAIAGLCAVFVDANDVIQVVDLLRTTTSVETLTDSNQIINFENPQSFTSVYSKVNVFFKAPTLEPSTVVATIEDLDVPTGGTTVDGIEFNAPVGALLYCTLEGATNSVVNATTNGANGASVTIGNTGAAEVVTLKLHAKPIGGAEVPVSATDATLYAMWPDRVLDIKSTFIQTRPVAMSYVTQILDLAKDPQAFYTLTTRGNPALELMDKVTIQSASSIKTTQNLTGNIIRHSLTYNGGLSCQMLLRKPLV